MEAVFGLVLQLLQSQLVRAAVQLKHLLKRRKYGGRQMMHSCETVSTEDIVQSDIKLSLKGEREELCVEKIVSSCCSSLFVVVIVLVFVVVLPPPPPLPLLLPLLFHNGSSGI